LKQGPNQGPRKSSHTAQHHETAGKVAGDYSQSSAHLVECIVGLLEKVEDQRRAEVMLIAIVHLQNLGKDVVIDVIAEVRHDEGAFVVLSTAETS